METKPQAKPQLNSLLDEVAAGFVRWLTEFVPETIRTGLSSLPAIAQDPELRDAIAREFKTLTEQIEAEIRAYEADPRSFLYDEMLATPGLLLLTKARAEGDEPIVEALADAFGDGALADHAIETLAEAPHLSAAQRERFRCGFAHLKADRWVAACDLLLKGVEGALWDAASALDVVDEQRHLLNHPRGLYATSPNRLVGEWGLSDLEPSYRRYVDRQLFDSRGHDLRHARADHDARAHALFAATATLGWLDQFTESRLMDELGDRLSRYADRLEVPGSAPATVAD